MLQNQTDKTNPAIDIFFQELGKINLLQKYELEAAEINKLKNNSTFIQKLSTILDNKQFTAARTLELYWHIFQNIDESISQREWLEKIYHFCRFLSFPDAWPEMRDIPLSRKKLYFIFLLTYRQIIAFSKNYIEKDSFLYQYPLNLLTPEEVNVLEQPEEYRRFLGAFDELFVYEMMFLSKEIYGYTTVDHVCGVHALALSVAKQIKKQGFSLDLGIVSGAAAGHDVGKYGCRRNEQKRVPHLHYYYTDIWFHRQNIPYIGHIAVNHSVWDLELENLSLEAIILIYSDFRVKNKINSNDMNIFSLQDSFQIILNKLDNLDEQKEKRYRRVFAKLRDFEDFLIAKGVDINLIPFGGKKYIKRKKDLFFALLHGDEIVQQIKYISLEHSFKMMFQLRNESSINSVLESARSEGSWQNLQEYLRIFSEYASYLNQNEKVLTLKFLYEQLIFPEEGIRRRSAKLIGYLIATFDEKYRKEIPDDVNIEPPKVKSTELLAKYIQLFVEPTYKTSELNQCRIRENLTFMFASLFENSQGRQVEQYLEIIKNYYLKYNNKVPEYISIYLLQALKSVPILLGQKFNQVFADFLLEFIQHDDYVLRLIALDVIDYILNKTTKNDSFWKRCQIILGNIVECSSIPAENYLRYKIVKKIKASKDLVKRFEEYCLQDIEKIERMYLNNLKSSTDAIIKQIQIDMLVERAKKTREEAVYTALHFCNILKVSSHEPIRNYAGRSLIEIIPYLNVEQKNDISIELLKALEIDDYQYTKYIPYYLGQSIPFLPPREINEFIDDLEEKIKIADQWTCTLLIRTLAVAISRYAPYRDRYREKNNSFERRLARMLGILMNGLAHHDTLVKRVTSRVIGKEIFGSSHLSLKEKNDIFRLIAKKYLNLIAPIPQYDTLLFFTNSVALHRLYVFIADYYFYEGTINPMVPESVAFFPGSFDPFSLSHKEIVREIEKLGMEVYLSVDEFSWSKRTQPHLYRKNLINMSIADELNVYLYPESLPSNIANPNDLKLLKKRFPKSEIHIVAGSDVLLNASAYNNIDNQNSIVNFPHIVFSRKSFQLSEKQQNKYQEIVNKITSRVIQLNLQAPFEEISSSQIRKNIDNHRDVSDLVDPLAERYIYKFGLYQREPQYKSTLQKIYTKVKIQENINDRLIEKLVEEVFPENIRKNALEGLRRFKKKLNPRIFLFKDTQKGEKILGFAAIHWVRSSMFYHEFRDNTISQYIRDNATGRTIVIDGVFTVSPDENTSLFRDLKQIILTEALTFCVKRDYDYAVFKNIIPETNSSELTETLENYGFTQIPVCKKYQAILSVDMRKPCTINLDIETLIKEPFVQSCKVIEVIELARKNLQKAITHLFPGHLLIPFNINMINQSIVAKVCGENGVPSEQENYRKLGPLMCVPFGKILHKMVVPNTVTKSLHTDKVFTPDMQHFKIDSFGYYMRLENQVKMIRSFNRPVLLIDDLLHKGYRLRALSPLLKKENIKVHKIIVGLLSGRGKELAMIQKRSVDGAYFIPNLRVWFNESDLYPFLGGDGLFRQESEQGNLVRSINMILPFAYPVFLKGVEHKIVYHLSQTCIENAINIMQTLEREYQAIYHRKLTLKHLGEVCLYPRYPDHGKYMNYNMSIATSVYLQNDLELLHRIWERRTKAGSKDLLLYPDSREFNLGKELI
jgi:nicotinic acid mononucleotide adenylyltransferase